MDIKEFKTIEKSHKSIIRHPWEIARLKVISRLFKDLMKKKNHYKTFVDIGCGDVFFLKEFSKTYPNAEYYGIDHAFTEDLLDFYNSIIDKNNIALFKDIKQLEQINKKADLIFILDVLEHVQDDNEFLLSLHSSSVVKNDTKLIITVPSFQSLFTIRDKWLGHEKRYNLKQLKRLLNSTGYEILKIHYFFSILIIPRTLIKIKELLFKPNFKKIKGIADWKGGKILGWIFEKMLLFDFYITKFLLKLNIKIPGLSCFVLCKKQQ